MRSRSRVFCDGCLAEIEVIVPYADAFDRAALRIAAVYVAAKLGWAANVTTGEATCPRCKERT